jgi:M6 family metalloprotease-like protein
MSRLPRCLALAVAFGLACGFLSAEPPKPASPDLSEFKTVETAVTTRISRSAHAGAQAPYLGLLVEADADGQLKVAAVEPDSPAAKAGLRKDDVLSTAAGQKLGDAAALRDLLSSKSPGDKLTVVVQREDKEVACEATLGAVSRPLSAAGPRAVMGITTGDAGDGVRIEQLTPDMPAAKAGLKEGDVILKIDGHTTADRSQMSGALGGRKPGDAVLVLYRRDGKEFEVKVTLAEGAGDKPTRGWDNRLGNLFKKDTYRLAVVPIDFPDQKHNDKIGLKDWDHALFSHGTYKDKSPTGQPVHGSVFDYYAELSCGKLRVEGKVFKWVHVGKKRADYATDSNRAALLGEALDDLEKRDGRDVLKDFDGVFFIYAGARVPTQRGGLYWPHRANFSHKGQRWNYFIVPEGGERMTNISVICHEFGHMLGLPDLYAKPEVPGMEGLGVWCVMSNQLGNGRPQHMCAWSKEQLGWLKPAVIDPTVKQKLILSPVEESSKECFKVLLQPDGSEYLLLENRRQSGFDKDLPGEGLLIWRVVDNRPVLEESHGIAGPEGPTRFPNSVPYPSPSNNAFTPLTTPSSRSIKGAGLPVYITNIRRLADGRITFWIGYEYL